MNELKKFKKFMEEYDFFAPLFNVVIILFMFGVFVTSISFIAWDFDLSLLRLLIVVWSPSIVVYIMYRKWEKQNG